MKIITFSRKVTVSTKHGEHSAEVNCNPGERLIFDDTNALSIQSAPGSSAYILEISDLEPMLRELSWTQPPHWRKKRVLFYRNRGHGDQLIFSSLPRFFRDVLGAEPSLLSDKVHEPLWLHNASIGGVALSVPLHLDAVWRANGARPFFDGTFFVESASEWDNDSEQPNVYDRLFGLAGLDPARVPAKFKRPTFTLTSDDIDKRALWLKQVGSATATDLAPGFIFIQLRATNKVRSIPPATAKLVLAAANEIGAKKNLTALVADNEPLAPEIAQTILGLEHVVNVATAIPTVRLLGSIIAGALAVIGPDSLALHFAAAAETPAIGLWGPFSPASRTKYYPRQTHLFHSELCPNAPCFNYLPDLPIAKCPNGARQQSCEVFTGITYDELYSALLDSLP